MYSLRQCLAIFVCKAEDGIRDATVTGVQTCALPISGDGPRRPPAPARGAARGARHHLAEGRSEERRVGKEGRSRWSPDHLKKKSKIAYAQYKQCFLALGQFGPLFTPLAL